MQRLLLLFVFLTIPTWNLAASPGEECCPQLRKWLRCGRIDGGAEALLWRPAHAGFDYVKSSLNSVGTLMRNKPGYDWGIRGYASYSFANCWDVRGSYTYVENLYAAAASRDSTMPPILSPVFGPSLAIIPQQFASSNVFERFQTADIEIGNTLVCNDRFRFKAFGGARWVKLEGSERYVYINFTPVTSFERQDTSFRGAGPRFGVTSTFYPIRCGIFRGASVEGTFATSAIIARRFSALDGTALFFFTADADIVHPETTIVSPAFDTKLKVNYCLSLGCLECSIYAAYELQWYQAALERIVSSTGIDFPETQVFGTGYAGWSFGINVKY